MKKEAEALYRAYLNMRSAHDAMMRQNDNAMLEYFDAVTQFASGHHDLFNALQGRITNAMAQLDRDLSMPATPPPPVPEDVDSLLERLRPTQYQQ